MGRLMKFLFRLIILGALAFIGYALFAELEAPEETVVIPLDNPAGTE